MYTSSAICLESFSALIVTLRVLKAMNIATICSSSLYTSDMASHIFMPRAELLRHTVIVLSVRPSVCLSVFYKHFSSLAEN